MSPKELAEELGQSTQHVSYHVRELASIGVVELVRTRRVRGATEHFYRIAERYNLSEEDVVELSAEDSAASLTHIFQLQFADVAASLDSGKMVERTNHHVSRRPLDLDEEGWATFFDAFEEFGERLDELQAAAIQRTKDDPGARSTKAMAHLNFIEMPDRDDRVNQF
jgi:hypothetical protein